MTEYMARESTSLVCRVGCKAARRQTPLHPRLMEVVAKIPCNLQGAALSAKPCIKGMVIWEHLA